MKPYQRKNIRTIIILIICTINLLSLSIKAQKEELRHIYYYDSTNHLTVKDSSVFQNKQYKTKDGWRIEFWERIEQPQFILYRSELKSDTSYNPAWIKIIRYYKNGTPMEYRFFKFRVPQSTIHYDKYAIKDAEIIYKNGHILQQLGYDSLGQKITPFVYEKEAQFSKNPKEWQDYISNNLNADIPRENNAPLGNYKVIVKFFIDTLGNVKNAKAIQDPGYGTSAEAVRVIKNSPKWEPAIYLNKKVKFKQSQLITFQVLNDAPKLFEDTIVKYIDAKLQIVNAEKAMYKLVDYKLNDTTRATTIFNIVTNQCIKKASVIFSTNKHVYSNIQTFNQNGKIIDETEEIDSKMSRVIKFYPNGTKSSDVKFGEDGIPINTKRWDQNGNQIK